MNPLLLFKKTFPILLTLTAQVLILWFLFNQQKEWALLAGISQKHKQPGGHDWVVWKDSQEGIRASFVHPLGEKLREEIGDYVQVGDILRKVDYVAVHNTEAASRIIRIAAPGKVFVYQLERGGTNGFEIRNIFVRNSVYPAFIAANYSLWWNTGYWLNAMGAFACLLSLFIVFPILRNRWKENLTKLLTILFAFLVFVFLFVRQVFLSASESLSSTLPETWFFPVISFFICGLSFLYLLSLGLATENRWAWLPGFPAALFLFLMVSAHNHEAAWIQKGQWLLALLLMSCLMFFCALILALFKKWKGRSLIDKVFTATTLALFLGQGILFFQRVLNYIPGEMPEDHEQLLFFLSLFAAPVSLTAGELKFGKVNVVLTQSLYYLLMGIVAVLAFSGIHQLFSLFGLNFRYQSLVELSVLVSLAFLFRALFQPYEDKVRQFFTLSQQSRLEDLNRFISSISRYTASEKLIKNLVGKIESWFGAGFATISGIEGTKEIFSEDTNEALDECLVNSEVFWSRNKQLSSLVLGEKEEQELMRSQIALIFPLRTKDGGSLLVLGKKGKGVYNLGEIELLGRILQQSRLTLEVLGLVERERLLVEKNYEANLTALRSQINPHFLFNTLNTISSLIHDAPNEAEGAIEKLAFIFRYTLKTSNSKFVALKEELALVKTYLEIEHLRFGERLEVIYEADNQTLDWPIPAMVLQTVVENSVKHGIGKIMGKGFVRIRTSIEGDLLICEIEDNGPGIDVSKIKSSTGLNNIITRMKEIYKTENLIYFENTGKGTLVKITIPKTDE